MTETATDVVSRAPRDPGVGPAAHFLTRLLPPPRDFDIRLWDGTLLRGGREPRFTMVIASAPAVRRIFSLPLEDSIGAAYMAGDVEVEGDLVASMAVADACREALRSPRRVAALIRARAALPAGGGAAGRGPRAPRLSGPRHSPDRDRAAVQHHYDLSNEFYQTFLDDRMVYSCGYFPTGTESLDRAQEWKLDHICRKLRLRQGERMLDVGCGWGGLLIHAAGRYGVTAVGITLSRAQRDLAVRRVAEAGLSDRVEIRLADYRDLAGETFDKAASVGMFEHVGRSRLPDYFARIFAAVRPGGLFLNHGISRCWAPQRLRAKALSRLERWLAGHQKIARSVFPDTELVPLSEVNLLAEQAGWEVRDVENLREHYALTLRHWTERLAERADQAIPLVGEPTFRLWRLYFAGNADRFDRGRIGLYQTLLARLDRGRASVPWSRDDIYRSA